MRDWSRIAGPLTGRDRKRVLEAIVELTFGYSITDSFDDDYLTMMQDSVSQSSSEGGIVVECLSPLVRRSVGGNDHRAGLVTSAEDLKQQVRTSLVNR